MPEQNHMLEPPSSLFKFRSLQGDARARTRDTILNHRNWWSAPADFNDPYDCAPAAVFDGSVLKRRGYVSRVVRDYGGHTRFDRRRMKAAALRRSASDIEHGFEVLQQQMRRDLAVFCLAQDPDHMLMWSHYADSHRGICLEFSTSFPDPQFFLAFPVAYSANRPIVSINDRDSSRLLEQVLLTKADYWSYEREWRVIDQQSGPGFRTFEPSTLRSVILGSAISRHDADEVRSWIKDSMTRARLRQARLDRNRYALHLVDL